jgi:hypothetical protein
MIDQYGRPMPPLESGEAATLTGFLDYQRATLEWKCRRLSDDQLLVALPPTSMRLGGMLTHMIEEYARHNGHADLIRQSLDGETGE